MAIIMLMSIFGVITCFYNDGVFADTKSVLAAADPANNKHTLPVKAKAGEKATIWADGARYEEVYSKWYSVNHGGGNAATLFPEKEYFYAATDMIVKHNTLGEQRYRFVNSMGYMPARHGEAIILNAGVYTVTTTFDYRYAGRVYGGVQPVQLYQEIPIVTDKKTDTFYVDAKINFSNNKKKGKLAKSKRIKYIAPTKKYGKLPKPKAKKGYKFKGWYTKKKGGKKITKNTVVPTANTITVYAQYKKK